MTTKNNKSIKIKQCKSFELGWSSMPNGFVVQAKKEIMQMWGKSSETTFISRKKGSSSMSPVEMMAVEIVHKKYGVNAWTGERD